MKLKELDVSFCAKADFANGDFHEQDSIDGAQGVMFMCPACQKHYVLCWFRNPRNAPVVPDTFSPGPGRWTVSGSSCEDLTLEPSVNLDTESVANYPDACKWHGWVKNGEAA